MLKASRMSPPRALSDCPEEERARIEGEEMQSGVFAKDSNGRDCWSPDRVLSLHNKLVMLKNCGKEQCAPIQVSISEWNCDLNFLIVSWIQEREEEMVGIADAVKLCVSLALCLCYNLQNEALDLTQRLHQFRIRLNRSQMQNSKQLAPDSWLDKGQE